MTDIIEFGEIARLKRLLDEKEKQIASLTEELQKANTTINTTSGINDLLRLQLKDLEATVEGWRKSLTEAQINIADMYNRLPTDLR